MKNNSLNLFSVFHLQDNIAKNAVNSKHGAKVSIVASFSKRNIVYVSTSNYDFNDIRFIKLLYSYADDFIH